jgi:F-type H+-transporting ATPase subunit c
MAGAALGVSNIFANFLSGALRNPSAAPSQTGNLIFGMAMTEALGIFSFLVALILLFVA